FARSPGAIAGADEAVTRAPECNISSSPRRRGPKNTSRSFCQDGATRESEDMGPRVRGDDSVVRPWHPGPSWRVLVIAALTAFAVLVCARASHAQEDDFYRGKTITIIIPIGPGGAYDAYARLIARHFGKYLPGNPTIVARNMPGAGGVIASNN